MKDRMRDRNIIIAILVIAMLALAACGGMNSGSGTAKEEASAETTVQIPNPWHETTDLEEAEKATGVDFEPPVENSLPEGFEFVTYRYTDTILEADYVKGDEEIVIRVSPSLSGLDLSGDYSEYSQEWEISLKGLIVHCQGDGTYSNCSTADNDEMHFAVDCNLGEEGKGLDEDQLMSLFMGMQAVPLR